MRLFFDTSVLVAGMVATHPAHLRAIPWLQRITAGVVAAHSVTERYAILTRLPLRPRISPAIARQLIDQNVLAAFHVVALSEAEYANLLVHLETHALVGGATYDALILHAASLAGVDQVLTLNAKDFRRVYPAMAAAIIEP